jgi:hypothetical protein
MEEAHLDSGGFSCILRIRVMEPVKVCPQYELEALNTGSFVFEGAGGAYRLDYTRPIAGTRDPRAPRPGEGPVYVAPDGDGLGVALRIPVGGKDSECSFFRIGGVRYKNPVSKLEPGEYKIVGDVIFPYYVEEVTNDGKALNMGWAKCRTEGTVTAR